jgi:hydrogenase-1 operon protein HyaF
MSTPAANEANRPSSLVLAVLHEVLAKLRDLASSGKSATIDLRRLPLTAGDGHHLRAMLGRGEVTAEFDALGPSKIIETRFAAVWWVTHMNGEGQIVGDTIEIAFVPEILMSSALDAGEAASRLETELTQLQQTN